MEIFGQSLQNKVWVSCVRIWDHAHFARLKKREEKVSKMADDVSSMDVDQLAQPSTSGASTKKRFEVKKVSSPPLHMKTF